MRESIKMIWACSWRLISALITRTDGIIVNGTMRYEA